MLWGVLLGVVVGLCAGVGKRKKVEGRKEREKNITYSYEARWV